MKIAQLALLYSVFYLLSTNSLKAQKAVTLPTWKVEPKELTVLNSPYRDVNISITPNGKYLYFMSGRGSMPWSSQRSTTFKGKIEYDGDIWFSRRAPNGDWGKPNSIGQSINTSSGEDEPNISADGQTVYFQSWKPDWRETGGPYYRAELHGDMWGKPVGIGGGINQFFQKGHTATDGMSVSPDGKTFVVACGDNYDGAMDIYISRKDAKGDWSMLEKLNISTAADERSAFIGADNKTLYFASAGWGGFGKLDIFKTTIEDGVKCGDVFNIGQPFNTAEEDYGFVMDVVRNDVYFVRNSDIFMAHLGETVADSRIQAAPVVIIDGTVKDENGKGVEAAIALQNEDKQTVAQSRSNAVTGEYSLSFPRKEGDYKQQIRFNDNYIVEKDVKVGSTTKQVIEQPIVAESAKLGGQKPAVVASKSVQTEPQKGVESTVTKSIYFDTDKDDLTLTSKEVLMELVGLAKSAKGYAFHVTGHTDDVGSDAYNQQLSEMRTHHAANFLISKGITPPIVSYYAKGEKEPAVNNNSETNRAKNRRVEIVLSLIN